jgi:hypothetical protein
VSGTGQEIGLTREDFAIFLDRVPYWDRSNYFKADRRDAINMAQREIEKHRSIFSWEAWATHRREWFPSSWGLPSDERVNPRTEACS